MLDDKNSSSSLENQFESLKPLSFKRKNIFLNIVNEQKKKSREITGSKDDDDYNTFIKPEGLDIKLHESMRIMSDWIRMLDLKYQANRHSSNI